MLGSDKISPAFISYAADILGDTSAGLSGSVIVRATATYAAEYGVNLPHPVYPYEAPNKRTALAQNLEVFSGPQQFRIILELCDHRSFSLKDDPERTKLKLKLIKDYAHFATEAAGHALNEQLIEETKHWLQGYTGSRTLYEGALAKYKAGGLSRNLLDDLRLALEKLLQDILGNEKSLENQVSALGQLVKSSGGSPEFQNMFLKLIDYYTKYQNSYVKHDDAVIEEEIEFVFEITSSFMKHLVRIA
ncbi:MAG: hypothetical protein HY985_00365 [Magnetospirillum sp.]|nr:hypothetical protein [Magnetospirillum sp.]